MGHFTFSKAYETLEVLCEEQTEIFLVYCLLKRQKQTAAPASPDENLLAVFILLQVPLVP